ncbi:hypothetical protein SLE2022_022470 [Rubroshorea leprosula]
MADSRVFSDSVRSSQRSGAGTIKRIRLENFMCHSLLQIDLCEWVNFITGQNGSGKSAILTALCVVFGCRAKDTQRASKLKDFIKTGSSYALVHVEIKNQGEDAFKPETYGDVIILERRISETTSFTILKDHQGKKVASRKEDLRELVEHFNIDVENPCVIMSQDKSREFLHSGNDKDKFKFFFKATLLQQVNDLLVSIHEELDSASAIVDELENSIRPVEKKLIELQEKIRNMEQVEEMSLEVQQLRKKLAWSWVYDVDKQMQGQSMTIEKLKDRIPACQAKIDSIMNEIEKLKDRFSKKKAQVACLLERTSEVRRRKDEFLQYSSMAKKQKFELKEEQKRLLKYIQKLEDRKRMRKQEVHDIEEQHVRSTQAEESKIEEKLKDLGHAIDAAELTLSSLLEEEATLSEYVSVGSSELEAINHEINDREKKFNEIVSQIRELQGSKINRVTAFGGERVRSLLQVIENRQRSFTRPPIGPIGAHVTLINGDTWAPAVEQALGNLLNAFVVTNHKDVLTLRKCAKDISYHNLQIVIYDFSKPRLNLPHHMLPQTQHPTTFKVLHSDNPTVLNVLVDVGHAERQVLVKDYDTGKAVAFEQRIPNLKEVYTLDGYKMFRRGSVQTILPPNKKSRIGRLSGSFDHHIQDLEKDASIMKEETQLCRKRKKEIEEKLKGFQSNIHIVKRRRAAADRDLMSKKDERQEVMNSRDAEANLSSAETVDELVEEISKDEEEIQQNKFSLEKLEVRMDEAEAKAKELQISFEILCESAKEDIAAFQNAEKELTDIEEELKSMEMKKDHYEDVMQNKVLHDIKEAEVQYQELQNNRKESCRKASIICPESEIEALGGWDGSNPEQLSARLNRLNQRLQRESQRYSESIDDLRMLYEEKERKILRKQQTYKAFREKLNACQKALELRWNKFKRNETLLRRQLTWQFNSHLGKKGISGHIKISYEEKTLSVEVKMPQDASSSTVRDTRGLSGGERSFSTLCFALALHEMTEAPFRAMDEFDVFMDAVSRKISLETLIDFALAQGSQWIFITPHDISMVKQGERVKKQQMAAPRS